MRTFFADVQLGHRPHRELSRGELLAAFEKPARAEMILAALRAEGLGAIEAPPDAGREPIERVHAPHFVDFLARAFDEWAAAHGADRDALPFVWPSRVMPDRPGSHIDAALGHYAFDASSPIMAGTFAAAYASAQAAVAGADALLTEGRAFALCRPPGHHATPDMYGGYCYLNNAAIAAEHLRAAGRAKVAILDVDYHHGNGTQRVFYARDDVFFASLHADPRDDYPYYTGHADERGEGPGEGHNLNLPLPRGTGWDAYARALDRALGAISDASAAALVVSLGTDTYREDPISSFTLDTPDFASIGGAIAQLRLPTLFVMEGGYAVEGIGRNVTSALTGFLAAR